MKKIFALFLCLLCVMALVACNSIFKDKHEHTYDYVCNEDTHQKVFTCGCPAPDIAEEHINYDADMHCDICGYFIDPTRVSMPLSSEEEWLDTVTAEEIVQIRTVRYGTLLGTGRLKEIRTVTDSDDIYKILASYRAMEITSSLMEYEINDNYYEAQFTFANGETKKIIINGDFLYKQYSISNLPLLNDYESAVLSFSFLTRAETGMVIEYTNGVAEVQHTVCHIPMDELEFVFVQASISDVYDYPYDVRTEIGTLDFHTSDLFTVAGEGDLCYRLVGENLDQLIDKYAPDIE